MPLHMPPFLTSAAKRLSPRHNNSYRYSLHPTDDHDVYHCDEEGEDDNRC